jgi:hypothetical protein
MIRLPLSSQVKLECTGVVAWPQAFQSSARTPANNSETESHVCTIASIPSFFVMVGVV